MRLGLTIYFGWTWHRMITIFHAKRVPAQAQLFCDPCDQDYHLCLWPLSLFRKGFYENISQVSQSLLLAAKGFNLGKKLSEKKNQIKPSRSIQDLGELLWLCLSCRTQWDDKTPPGLFSRSLFSPGRENSSLCVMLLGCDTIRLAQLNQNTGTQFGIIKKLDKNENSFLKKV